MTYTVGANTKRKHLRTLSNIRSKNYLFTNSELSEKPVPNSHYDTNKRFEFLLLLSFSNSAIAFFMLFQILQDLDL